MKEKQGIADATIIFGRTKVIVKKRVTDDRTRRETVSTVHQGIVVGRTSSFLRVYNPQAPKDGGDTSQDNAELFPMESKNCWCEYAGVLDEDRALPLSPTLK
jgi:hypothetical protein